MRLRRDSGNTLTTSFSIPVIPSASLPPSDRLLHSCIALLHQATATTPAPLAITIRTTPTRTATVDQTHEIVHSTTESTDRWTTIGMGINDDVPSQLRIVDRPLRRRRVRDWIRERVRRLLVMLIWMLRLLVISICCRIEIL